MLIGDSHNIGEMLSFTEITIDYSANHDDVIKWKHFPRYWPFVRGIHRGQMPVTRSFDVFLIYARINGWVNTGEAGDLRRHHTYYDVIVMYVKRHTAYRLTIPWNEEVSWSTNLNLKSELNLLFVRKFRMKLSHFDIHVTFWRAHLIGMSKHCCSTERETGIRTCRCYRTVENIYV